MPSDTLPLSSQLLRSVLTPASQLGSHVRLHSARLQDVLERQVRTVVNAKQKGRYEQQPDARGLFSGAYFLRLEAGGQTRTQQLTVVR